MCTNYKDHALKWKWSISLALDVDVNEIEFVEMPIILSFAQNICKAQELPQKTCTWLKNKNVQWEHTFESQPTSLKQHWGNKHLIEVGGWCSWQCP